MSKPTLDAAPPNSLESEQAVLGAMMLDRGAIVRACELLKAEDFYRDAHRALFAQVADLHEAGDAVDLVSLGTHLKEHGDLDRVGGMPYLSDLVDAVPTAANVERYARTVRNYATLRGLLVLGGQVADRAQKSTQEELPDLLNWMTGQLDDLSRGHDTDEFAPLHRHTDALVEELIQQQQQGRRIRGLRTGFSALDRALGGLRGQRVVIGARTSDGKTALLLNLLCGVARQESVPVALFSLEQPGGEIATKVLASDTGIEPRLINAARFEDDDWFAIREGQARAHETAVWICDRAGMTVEEIRRKTRGIVHREGVRVVGVDFLQICATSRRCDSEALRVGWMMQRLTDMARQCRVSLLIASQLNREADRLPPGEPPGNEHLKESSSIEQYADATLLLAHDLDDSGARSGSARMAMRKNRMGPSGFTIELIWMPERQLFGERDTSREEDGSWHQKL